MKEWIDAHVPAAATNGKPSPSLELSFLGAFSPGSLQLELTIFREHRAHSTHLTPVVYAALSEILASLSTHTSYC